MSRKFSENFTVASYLHLREELEEIYGVRRRKRRSTSPQKKLSRKAEEEIKEDIFSEMEKLWHTMTEDEQEYISSYVPSYVANAKARAS